MSDNLKKEARKQYLHYFRIWFVIVGILLVLTIVMGIRYSMREPVVRLNTTAPTERVYDYADVLTDSEEQKLRDYIAKKELEYQADFVIMTFSQPVEGDAAKEEYGYDSTDWQHNMTDIADNFWDTNGYGFNKDFEGDGSILIDNRYEGQRGEWLSTSGKVEDSLGTQDVENVLYAVDKYYDANPYLAYLNYIDEVCYHLEGGNSTPGVGTFLLAAVISAVVAAIYAASHLSKNKAKKTVAVNAYVAGGRPSIKNQGDQFIRKNVVKRRIETSSGSSSGGSSGGGGHHVSHSGASHGGGGHRH